MIELRNALFLASCLFTFFCQFRRFCFNTVEQILAYRYFGKIRENALLFKAHVSIQCIVKLSIGRDYPTSSTLFCFILSENVSLSLDMFCVTTAGFCFFYSSDGKLLEESTASICKGVAINNCKSGNFGAVIRNFLVRATELKASVQCDE